MLFNFGLESSLLLFGFLHGIIFLVLLLKRGIEEDRLADKLLATLLLLSCLHISQYMLGFGGWYDSQDAHSTFMFYFPFHNTLFFGPIIYFYFLAISNSQFKLERKHVLHFIPGALMVFIFAFMFSYEIGIQHLLQGQELPLHFGTQGNIAKYYQDHIAGLFNDLGFISMFIYISLTIAIYQNYRKYIDENFSNTEEITYTWLRNILSASIALIAFGFIIDIIDKYFANLDYDEYWISYFGVVVFIYFISIAGYIGTKHLPSNLHFVPKVIPTPEAVPGESKQQQEDLTLVNQWKDKLAARMREEAYLNPSLSLQDLATQLQTNTSILSKMINSGFGMNFNDFINSHRVEAVKVKLQAGEHQQLTLTSIAYDCGFNSKATFNRAFKKFTGKSPREYLLQIENTTTVMINK